ncbi:MAG: pyridoxal phosphate-dependent decarboxylase family protein, partial [Chitinophagales bacterium]
QTIQQLEQQAKLLEPDETERQKLLQTTQEYINRFFDQKPSRPIYYPFENIENTTFGNYETGESFENMLKLLSKVIDKRGLDTTRSGHMGYIPSGGLFLGALGDFIATAGNNYVGLYSTSPGGVELENNLLDWMCRLIGYDTKMAGGNLASGGSIANLTAMVAARDAKLEMKDWHKAVIYTTSETHHCVHKALKILGFKANYPNEDGAIHYIATDDHYRMQAEALASAIEEDKKAGKIPWLIVASAGTTNLGIVDPLEAIGTIAQDHDVWLHIDAAYGGFFLLSDLVKERLKGIDLADSVVMDAHKSLFLPFGLGAVLLKNKDYLFDSFYYTANYLNEAEKYSPANLSPELTKPFRGLRMWLPLKMFGADTFRAALDEKILLARYLHQKIDNLPNWETINYPDLTVFAFRYVPTHLKDDNSTLNQVNKYITKQILTSGKVFLTGTTLEKEEVFVIRVAILSIRTHLETVEQVVTVLNAIVAKLPEQWQG